MMLEKIRPFLKKNARISALMATIALSAFTHAEENSAQEQDRRDLLKRLEEGKVVSIVPDASTQEVNNCLAELEELSEEEPIPSNQETNVLENISEKKDGFKVLISPSTNSGETLPPIEMDIPFLNVSTNEPEIIKSSPENTELPQENIENSVETTITTTNNTEMVSLPEINTPSLDTPTNKLEITELPQENVETPVETNIIDTVTNSINIVENITETTTNANDLIQEEIPVSIPNTETNTFVAEETKDLPSNRIVHTNNTSTSLKKTPNFDSFYSENFNSSKKENEIITYGALGGLFLLTIFTVLVTTPKKRKQKIEPILEPEEDDFGESFVFSALGVKKSKQNPPSIENKKKSDLNLPPKEITHPKAIEKIPPKKKISFSEPTPRNIPITVNLETPQEYDEESYQKGIRLLAINKLKRSDLNKRRRALRLERETASPERQNQIDALLEAISQESNELSIQRRRACTLIKGKQGEKIKELKHQYTKKMTQLKRLSKKDGLPHLEEMAEINSLRAALNTHEKELLSNAKKEALKRTETAGYLHGIRLLTEVTESQKAFDDHGRIFEYMDPVSRYDQMWDFLLILLFVNQIKKAIRKGLFRKYRCFEYNDAKVKGSIDVARHIRYNMIGNGRIAYSTREYTLQNEYNILLLQAYRTAEKRYPEYLKKAVLSDRMIKDTIR